MPVRLIRPYQGQAANTIFWTNSAEEADLRATGTADDQLELASDYGVAVRNVTATTANTSRNATTYRMNSASAQTLTLAASGYWPIGQILTVVNQGGGSATVTPATGVTINGTSGSVTVATQVGEARIIKVGPDTWLTMDGFSSNVSAALGSLGVLPVLEKLRRAAQRAYAFNSEDAGLATGVTLTQSGTAPTGMTGTLGKDALAAKKIRVTGGCGTVWNNSVLFPVANISDSSVSGTPGTGNIGSQLTATPGYSAWGWEVSLATESATVVLNINAAALAVNNIWFLIDGQYVTKAPTTPGVGGSNYFKLDFAGVRKARTITVLGSVQMALNQVFVDPTSDFWAPQQSPDRIVALFTGDSYGEGQGATTPGQGGWAKKAARRLGWTDARQVAVGATGFFANSNGTRLTIRQQIPYWFTVNSDLDPSKVDVVPLAGGFNDRTALAAATITQAQLQAEALYCMGLTRAACPNALIVVRGSWSANTGPSSTILQIEAALSGAFAQFADGRSIYLPVSTAIPSYILGTGRVGATTGVGNADFDISSDATHYSDAGHEMDSIRFASDLRAAIQA